MIALITGATSGIGKAAAIIFAKNGYNIIITGRRRERLEELKKELTDSYNVEVAVFSFDIRKQEEIKAVVASFTDQWKEITVLVNNAGLAAGLAPFQEGNIDDWDLMIDTNLKGLVYISRIIAPMMISNGKGGHIINIGSIAGKEVYANGNVYCATKHAVDAISKAMRIDLLPHGIKVTAVHPGMVETEFSIVRFKGDVDRAKKVYEGMQPLTAEDVADTIYWVATRPLHVNINDIVIMPTVQAAATTTLRKL